MKNNARNISYNILRDFEISKTRLDRLESKYKLNNNLSRQDKKLAKNLINGTVRHLLYLDWVAGQLYYGNYKKLLIKIKIILRMALYELIFIKGIPARATINEYVNMAKKVTGVRQANMINALLRNYTRGKAELNTGRLIKDDEERLSIQYSFPRWLIKRWIAFWGLSETGSLCAALNRLPDFDLRINTRLISVKEFIRLLEEAEIEYKKSLIFDNRIKIKDIQIIIEKGWFDQGFCSLQDESAALPVEALNIENGDYILDICSAPGGKLTQILEQEKSNLLLTALDIDIDRLKTVRANVKRLKKENVFFIVADGKSLPLKPIFTKVLLDAPCSGLGVMRKHPDIKWRRTMEEIMEFSQLQQDLISEAGKILRHSGRLLYSTCTLDDLENSNIADFFLRQNRRAFKQVKMQGKLKYFERKKYIQTLPQYDDMDGAFCALFEKI